jgi:predicted transcriptional regulator
MARPPSLQPTDGEMEILKVLWAIGPAELGRIRATVQERRPVATTTIATMLKVMLGKIRL